MPTRPTRAHRSEQTYQKPAALARRLPPGAPADANPSDSGGDDPAAAGAAAFSLLERTLRAESEGTSLAAFLQRAGVLAAQLAGRVGGVTSGGGGGGSAEAAAAAAAQRAAARGGGIDPRFGRPQPAPPTTATMMAGVPAARGEPARRAIPKEQWEQRLASVAVSKADLNRLVMDFLVTEGYAGAARAFEEEAGARLGDGGAGGDGGGGGGGGGGGALGGIEARARIRAAVQAGRVEDAIDAVNDLDPEVMRVLVVMSQG